jgi:tryptophan-rich sensory protein
MGNIIVIIALAAVAFILLAGLFVMSMGGQIDKKWSNRLMRYRVLAQAVAILIVLAVLYFSNQQ